MSELQKISSKVEHSGIAVPTPSFCQTERTWIQGLEWPQEFKFGFSSLINQN